MKLCSIVLTCDGSVDQNMFTKPIFFWTHIYASQWRIQDFPDGSANPKWASVNYYLAIFTDNCVKIKKIWPRGGASANPPPDPPMHCCRYLPVLSPFHLWMPHADTILLFLSKCIPNTTIVFSVHSQHPSKDHKG